MLFTSQLRDLAQSGVRFVIVGGVAAGLHGSARATLDLDICYDPAADNRERLAAVLKSWRAYLRGVEPSLPFELDARALAASHVLTLASALGDVDVMDSVDGVGGFPQVLAHSVEMDVGDGLRCRVLSLEALVKAKRTVRRRKDVDQLPELEALLEIKRKSTPPRTA